MKRYYESHNRGEYEGMEECSDGDWVRYEDVQELQRQLDEERARLDWVLRQVSWEGPRIGIEFCWPADDDPRETIDRERIKGEKA